MKIIEFKLLFFSFLFLQFSLSVQAQVTPCLLLVIPTTINSNN